MSLTRCKLHKSIQSNTLLLFAVLFCCCQCRQASARMLGQVQEPLAPAATAQPAAQPAQSMLQQTAQLQRSQLRSRASAPVPAGALVATTPQRQLVQQLAPVYQPVPRDQHKPTTPLQAASRTFSSGQAEAVGTAAVASMAAAAVQTALGTPPSTPSVVRGLPPATPISLLFGDPKYSNPQLSTDQQLLAYIKPAPSTGASNIFVRKLPPAGSRPSNDEGYESEISIFDRAGTDGDKQVTFDDNQGVSAYSWSEDSSSIFYIQDKDGDENYHLYMAPVTRPGPAIDLTPFPGVKAQGIVSNELFPRRLFISLNRRDPAVHDLYILDTTTLKLTLHTVNPGDVSSWLLDYDFGVRGAECYNNSNGALYVTINDALPPLTQPGATLRRQTGVVRSAVQQTNKPLPAKADVKDLEKLFTKAEKEQWGMKQWIAASSSKADVARWRKLIEWPFGEEGGVFKFNRAGDGLYVVSSLGRDTTELQLISTSPGAKVLQRIASNPLANVNSVEFDQQTWIPQMVSFDYLKVNWQLLDDSLKQDWQRLEAFRPEDEVTLVDRSLDSSLWIVAYVSPSVNSKYYLHRPGTWPPELLFDTQPALLSYSTAKTHPVVIRSRDGLLLPSYLSLPVKSDIPSVLPSCLTGPVPDGPAQGRAAVQVGTTTKCTVKFNLPLVLMVHGGPWYRDTWGSDPAVQLMTNRGYAVLQVNFRASSGYGKRFTNLGNKQWGVGTMQHDLTDAVKWATSTGIAHPGKVCIMGGSYGGYAVLAGLTFTPDLYACGVDLVGISNVATFMKSFPPYWKPVRYEWETRVGPADTNATLNQQISPLFHVSNIKAPLLITQGKHDPRVPKAESDQMFKAMHAQGLPVEYVLYTDEGHGVERPENRQDYYGRVERFLAKYLGGRVEAPQKLEDVSAVEIKTIKDLEKHVPVAAGADRA